MKKVNVLILLLVTVLSFNAAVAQSNNQVEYINLKGDTLFPEGIHTLPNGDLLVGGFGDGSIQRINSKNEVSYFSQSGENGKRRHRNSLAIQAGFLNLRKSGR